MAEALMLRAPTSRLANQVRSHARVLASLKLSPAPGEYTLTAAVRHRRDAPSPAAPAAVHLTEQERTKIDVFGGGRQTTDRASNYAPPAVESERSLSTGKAAFGLGRTVPVEPDVRLTVRLAPTCRVPRSLTPADPLFLLNSRYGATRAAAAFSPPCGPSPFSSLHWVVAWAFRVHLQKIDPSFGAAVGSSHREAQEVVLVPARLDRASSDLPSPPAAASSSSPPPPPSERPHRADLRPNRGGINRPQGPRARSRSPDRDLGRNAPGAGRVWHGDGRAVSHETFTGAMRLP